jgi:DNA polymerase-3 subunit delta'
MGWNQFAEQPVVADLLSRSLKNGRLAHAYLLSGPRGAGKKRIALHLAKSLFCERLAGDACGECLSCRRIEAGNHPDVHVVSPDGTSVKIDQIRSLRREMTMRAVESVHKVYIIEHVDRMTTQAANSLLKFLEEPPFGVLALLLTENSHAVLPTILSRCQQIALSPLPPDAVAQALASAGIPLGPARVAAHITTDVEDARQLCQSDRFAQLRNEVIQLVQEVKQRNSLALYTVFELFSKSDKGKEELPLFLDLFILWLRDLLYVQAGRLDQLANADKRDVLNGQASLWTQAELVKGISAAMDTRNRLERHANAQLALERLVLQLQEG